MRSINKLSNEYADAIDPHLYATTPKAVLAAIAASALTNGGDSMSEVNARIAGEWAVLHANGIVPQKPSTAARALLTGGAL